MKYKSSAAFRRALADRLRQQAIASSTPLARLRKMVAFERFLARLIATQPDAWVLKGGLALQFRPGRHRTSHEPFPRSSFGQPGCPHVESRSLVVGMIGEIL
ncbi:MAG: hypothetical protein ACPL4H_04700 [Anaerolineales bacterium]